MFLVPFFLFVSIYSSQFIEFPPPVKWENFEHESTLVSGEITTITTGTTKFDIISNKEIYYYLKTSTSMWSHVFVSEFWVLPEAVCTILSDLLSVSLS
jgi:hypothetical protein